MKIKLMNIACTRSGDKGDSSNIGVVFEYKEVYDWAVENITSNIVKKHLSGILSNRVASFDVDGYFSDNFIDKMYVNTAKNEVLEVFI